ncbi:hypothetical protein Bca4012_094895 [Brassica carinata]
MSVLSWNCQGAGSIETVQRLRRIRRQYFPDFLFLMETKQKESYVRGFQTMLGYDECVTVEPVGRSGGLAVMWKSCYEVEALSKDYMIIDLKVNLGSLSFFLTCVYGDPMRGRRRAVWEKLISVGVNRDEAWMLIGDFNELMNNSEKLGGAIREESTFWDFRNMAEACKIKEHISVGNSLSWRDKVWVQCRLDRSFGNDEWFHIFLRSKAVYMGMRTVEHRLLRLSFAYEPEEQNRGRFFFDKRMVGKRGVKEAVASCWEWDGSDTEPNLMDCIAKCRSELAKLKRTENLNSKNRIDTLKAIPEIGSDEKT